MKPQRTTDLEPVYIVDDDASVRDSLSLMLSLHGHRTSTFASAEDFLRTAQPDWRGCVLADIRMPGLSGLQLQERLAEQCPHLSVVIVTAHGDLASARQAFLAQAVDFLQKPFDADQVRAAIASAARARTGPRKQPRPLPGEKLSPRELEVLQCVTTGLHNRQIAAQLGISPRTVEVHKARLMEKLGVNNIVELVRLVDGGSPV